MITSLAPLYFALTSIFAASSAWVLMWVTDRLYDWGIWWLAAPIRIGIFFAQLGVLITCLCVIIFLAIGAFSVFKAASKGLDADSDKRLSFKGYMLLLLTPIIMGVSTLLFPLFNNWLDFGERGLGIIAIGYLFLVYALAYGSILFVLAWLVVLPFFLRKRVAVAASMGVGTREE